MVVEVVIKEKNLRSCEQVVIDGENDLYVGEKIIQFKYIFMIVMYRCMCIILLNVVLIEFES